jgi:hypothetical protein
VIRRIAFSHEDCLPTWSDHTRICDEHKPLSRAAVRRIRCGKQIDETTRDTFVATRAGGRDRSRWALACAEANKCQNA